MYKTILVHADATPRSAQRIDVAARLALLHEAHLVGAALTGMSAYLFPSAGLDPSAPAIVFPIDELRAEADSVLDAFDQRASQSGVLSFERRRIDDEAGAGIALHARYADLVVISQSAPGEFMPRLRTDFPDYVVLHCARPVLIVPRSGTVSTSFQRVTVAWNGSLNAVRALTSAIPILQRAQAVELVVLGDASDSTDPLPGADMATYLARHGVRVTVSHAPAGADAGESLLSFAADHASDLIVMGAYGHSRVGEILLGGASRTVLRSSPIALWMMH